MTGRALCDWAWPSLVHRRDCTRETTYYMCSWTLGRFRVLNWRERKRHPLPPPLCRPRCSGVHDQTPSQVSGTSCLASSNRGKARRASPGARDPSIRCYASPPRGFFTARNCFTGRRWLRRRRCPKRGSIFFVQPPGDTVHTECSARPGVVGLGAGWRTGRLWNMQVVVVYCDVSFPFFSHPVVMSEVSSLKMNKSDRKGIYSIEKRQPRQSRSELIDNVPV
ncbi:hypothetical protein J3F83DRAFT_207045 [Trichoderma novae-zelandiae]